MGDITKTLFGGGETEQSGAQSSWSKQGSKSGQKTTFGVTKTPFSSFQNGTLSLDPSIRALQEESLASYRNLSPVLSGGVDDFISKMGTARSSLLGNQGALRQARLNPIQEAIARRRGELGQSVGLRGLGGSSFGEQAMSNFDMDSARSIGEASALADADTLQAVTGIDKDILNTIIGKVQMEAQLSGLPAEIAQQRLQQELQAFLLGKGSESTAESWGESGSTGTSSGSSWRQEPILQKLTMK